MSCRKCGSDNIETIRRPDSLHCLYPYDEFVERCAECGDITSRGLKDTIDELIRALKKREEGDGEDT